MALEQLIIRDWSPGLVTQPDTQDLPEGSCAVLENFHVTDKPGKLVGRARFGEVLAGPTPAPAGFTRYIGAYVYTVDRPSAKDIYLFAATDGAGSALWTYPGYNAGWTTNWSARTALNGTPDNLSVIVRHGEARIYTSQPVLSGYTGKWYGYVDRDYFNNINLMGQQSKDDFFMEASVLTRPLGSASGIGLLGPVEYINTSVAGLPANYYYASTDYILYEATFTSNGYEESLPDFKALFRPTGNAVLRMDFVLDPSAMDERLTHLNIWRAHSTAPGTMPTRRLLYEIDLTTGYTLPLSIIRHTKTASKIVGTGGAFSLNQCKAVYYPGGFTSVTTEYYQVCGNLASSGGSTTVYGELPKTATVGTDAWVISAPDLTTYAFDAALSTPVTLVVVGNATAEGSGVDTIITHKTQVGEALRGNMTTAVYDGGTNRTSITRLDGLNANAFSAGDLRIHSATKLTAVTFTTVYAVATYHMVLASTALRNDLNPVGVSGDLTLRDIGIKESYQLFVQIPYVEAGTAFPSNYYDLFFYLTAYASEYPQGVSYDMLDVGVKFIDNGASQGTIGIWDHKQDIAGNPTLDAVTGVSGGRETTADALGRFVAVVDDRVFLGHVLQGGEQIEDGVLYSTWQSAGIAHDLYDPLNLIVFGGGDSGRIRGVVEFGNQLYVFKDYEVFVASVDYVNQDRVQAQRFPDGRGLLAERSLVKTSGAVYYLSHDGFRRIANGRSENVSLAIKDSVLAISAAYREAAAGAWDNVYQNVVWLVRTSTTRYQVFVLEKEAVWSTYTIDVSSGDTLSLVQHPSGALMIVKLASAVTYFVQLGFAGTRRLNEPTYRVRTNHLLASLNADSLVRQVYWRGLNNTGASGTLSVYTEGQLSASFTVTSSANVQDLVFQLQVDRSAGSYASHLGAYHELEFTVTSAAISPALEIHHMGLSFTRSNRSRMAA